ARDVIENRLRAVLTEALAEELGSDVQIAVTVDPGAAGSETPLDELTDEVADGTFAADLDAAGLAHVLEASPGGSVGALVAPAAFGRGGDSGANARSRDDVEPGASRGPLGPPDPTAVRPGSGQPGQPRQAEPSRLN